MKIKDLINELSKFDPETEANIYFEAEEAYGDIDIITKYTKDDEENMPYSKQDPYEIRNNEVIIISCYPI